MSVSHDWHLVIYDIRDTDRYRSAYKVIKGYGTRVQYSVFRVSGSRRHIERLRWELERILEAEDDLLIIPLCKRCVDTMRHRNRDDAWPEEPDAPYTILGD